MNDSAPKTGVYGMPAQHNFKPPTQPPEDDGSIHVYGAPVPQTFAPPVSAKDVSAPVPTPAAEPAAAQTPYTPPTPSPAAPKKVASAGLINTILGNKKLVMLGSVAIVVILIVVLIASLGNKQPSIDPGPQEMETPPGNDLITSDPIADAGADYTWWSGDWYGWWVVWSGSGKYEDLTDQAWDACAKIAVDGENGSLLLWNSNGSATDYMAVANISFGPGLTENGCFMSENGYFMNDPLEHADWIIDAGVGYMKDFDHAICIDGRYTDPENEEDSYDYYIFLRPWGMDWEDVRNADNSDNLYNDMMPMQYDSWYLPLIKSGAQMPNSFDGA